MILSNAAAWLLLVFCGFMEVVWAITARYTENFTKPGMTALCLAIAIGNTYLLSYLFRSLPVGVAYTAWIGLGIIGVALASFVLFGERLSAWQMASIFVILGGIAGLKLT